MAKGNIDAVLKQLKKRYGASAIRKLSEGPAKVEVQPSGVLALDIIMGGGFPLRGFTEIYGPPMSGKTTIAILAMKEVLKNGGRVYFVDAENAFNPAFAKILGLDVDDPDIQERFIYTQPDYGEMAFDLIEEVIPFVDMVVVDSVSALVPKSELEGEVEDKAKIGEHARLMSRALKRLVAKLKNSTCSVLFINQERVAINTFGFQTYGTQTTGGKALQYYAMMRLEVKKGSHIKGPGGDTIGHTMKITVTKNKVFRPFMTTNIDLYYQDGIDYYGMLLDLGLNYGFIERAGSYYSLNTKQGTQVIGQGKENAKKWLQEHPEVVERLNEAIIKKALMNEELEQKLNEELKEAQESSE